MCIYVHVDSRLRRVHYEINNAYIQANVDAGTKSDNDIFTQTFVAAVFAVSNQCFSEVLNFATAERLPAEFVNRYHISFCRYNSFHMKF